MTSAKSAALTTTTAAHFASFSRKNIFTTTTILGTGSWDILVLLFSQIRPSLLTDKIKIKIPSLGICLQIKSQKHFCLTDWQLLSFGSETKI